MSRSPCREAEAKYDETAAEQKLFLKDHLYPAFEEAGLADKVFPKMAELIKENMEKWAEGALKVEVIVFSNEYTELVSTEKAHEYLERTI